MESRLIDNLKKASCFPHAVENFEVFETHISWVLATGEYAYKIKKPIDFGFLDFSTLEKRKFNCDRELEFNSRLAPKLYLDVVPITGTMENPVIEGDGPIIDYAVKMKQFSQDNLFDRIMLKGKLEPQEVISIADQLAQFHQTTPIVSDSFLGSPEAAHKAVTDNFDIIEPLLTSEISKSRLNAIRAWAEKTFVQLKPLLANRKASGYARECHGDLHLGNIALVNGEAQIFDCIEFNDKYRCIDSISDTAFIMMDLEQRGLPAYAYRLINRYLEQTGDYQGVRLLTYYLCYRAMVRAKIARLRLNQGGSTPGESKLNLIKYQSYLSLAERYTMPRHPGIVLMHGFSGSGKSTVASSLAEQLGAIRIRSDIERLRLYADKADIRYSEEATKKTFEQMKQIAEEVISSGYTAIVDARFESAWQRDIFFNLAKTLDVPVLVVHCYAPENVLSNRIVDRGRLKDDVSEATVEVLKQQFGTYEPLTDNEKKKTIEMDTTLLSDLHILAARINNYIIYHSDLEC